jgi:predicted ATPase/DNA-binding NarL/FixJ family response regulator
MPRSPGRGMCRGQAWFHSGRVRPPGPRFELNAFVGRSTEQIELLELLRDAHIVTLTGSGGVGKSRLAARVAQRASSNYADGVVVVDVGQARDPPRLTRLLIDALRSGASGDLLALTRDIEQAELLVVLDNCEHLIAACADLTLTLIVSCPRLRILATSRQALRVPGEHTSHITPLPLPSACAAYSDIVASEAVALFVTRAQEIAPAFQLGPANATRVASVCRRLDGLPLAIELAAARAGVLSVPQLEAELVDSLAVLDGGPGVPPRHQTLHANLAWSVALLREPERRLLCRLSVLGGAWTLDTARQVCAADDLPVGDILPVLAELVDTSLVQVRTGPGATRFVLLETTRYYAAQMLETSGEACQVRARHVAWCLALCAGLEAEPTCAARLAQLIHDADNLRAALQWTLQGPAVDMDVAFGLANALHHVWLATGASGQGLACLERIIDLPGGEPDARAGALCHAAVHARRQGQLTKSFDYVSQALAIAMATDNAAMHALALTSEAETHLDRGHLSMAERALGDARDLELGVNHCHVARASAVLAMVCLELADMAQAAAWLETSLAVLEDPATELVRSTALRSAARLAIAEGNLRRAECNLAQALEASRDAHDPNATLLTLLAQADLAVRRGQSLIAYRAAGEAVAVATTVDDVLARIRALEGCAMVLGSPAGDPLAHVAATCRARLGLERWPSESAALASFDYAPSPVERLSIPAALDMAGELLARAVAADAPDGALAGQLTRRQQEVARLVAHGRSTREIAETLVISEGTARAHVEHIRTRLGVSSRADIAPHLGLSQN